MTDKTNTNRNDALRAEHPELVGVQFNPNTVEAGFETAAETGERQVIARTGGPCTDPTEECNYDHVTYFATPEGEIDVKRTHTW